MIVVLTSLVGTVVVEPEGKKTGQKLAVTDPLRLSLLLLTYCTCPCLLELSFTRHVKVHLFSNE